MEPGLTDNRLGDFSPVHAAEVDDGLTDDLRARFKGDLEPGERLLWAARSDPPVESFGAWFYVLGAIALLYLGMGVVAVGIPSVFGTADARAQHRFDDRSTIIGGLNFLGFGCVFMVGSILVSRNRLRERRRKSNACYAVTDRRAIVCAPEPKGNAIRVQAVARGQFRNVVRVERPDGSGNLEFRETLGDVYVAHGFTFEHVPDVRRVEQIVRNNLITSEATERVESVALMPYDVQTSSFCDLSSSQHEESIGRSHAVTFPIRRCLMPEDSAPLDIHDVSLAATSELGGGLTDDLRARLKGELEPGERLLWAARSDPPFEPPSAGFLVSIAIALVCLAVGVAIAAPRENRHAVNDSTMTAGLVFLGIGCLFVIGLIAAWRNRWSERRRLSNVCYAITNRRAIVWAPEPKGDAIRVHTVPRGQVRKLVRIECPNGSGSLEFSGEWENIDFEWHPFGFKHIPEVRRVEQIIRNNLITSEQFA